jgi:hypothetical protein
MLHTLIVVAAVSCAAVILFVLVSMASWYWQEHVWQHDDQGMP